MAPCDQAQPCPFLPFPEQIALRGLSPFLLPNPLHVFFPMAPPPILRACSFPVLVVAGTNNLGNRRILSPSFLESPSCSFWTKRPPDGQYSVSLWHRSLQRVLSCLSQYSSLSPLFGNANLCFLVRVILFLMSLLFTRDSLKNLPSCVQASVGKYCRLCGL